MFYDRFIELCDKKGIKPTPLVTGMGLSSSNVSQWKKGSTPRPEVIQRLAEYFGVSVSYLMFGEDDKKEKPAPKTGNGQLPEGYFELNPENKALVDSVMAAGFFLVIPTVCAVIAER